MTRKIHFSINTGRVLNIIKVVGIVDITLDVNFKPYCKFSFCVHKLVKVTGFISLI